MEAAADTMVCTRCSGYYHWRDAEAHGMCKDCVSRAPVWPCEFCQANVFGTSAGDDDDADDDDDEEEKEEVLVANAQKEEGEEGKAARCKSCVALWKRFGEPGECTVCGCRSAFGQAQCRRCTRAAAKYGEPQACRVCERVSVFGRNTSRMCVPCVLAYKREKRKRLSPDTPLPDNRPTKRRRLSQRPLSPTSADIVRQAQDEAAKQAARVTQLQRELRELNPGHLRALREEWDLERQQWAAQRAELEEAKQHLEQKVDRLRVSRNKAVLSGKSLKEKFRALQKEWAQTSSQNDRLQAHLLKFLEQQGVHEA